MEGDAQADELAEGGDVDGGQMTAAKDFRSSLMTGGRRSLLGPALSRLPSKLLRAWNEALLEREI